MKIPIGFNYNLYQKGMTRVREYWDIDSCPHMAVAGATGSGKTVNTKIIIYSILMFIADAQVTILDFKGDSDYTFISSFDRLYRFDEVKQGFDLFYSELLERQGQNAPDKNHSFMVLDEFPSFLNYLGDKKEAEKYKQQLATILMLGRSFNMHILLSQQRLDAEYFNKARDNIGAIVVYGAMSKEVEHMFFGEYKDVISSVEKPNGRGEGYMLENGSELTRIKIPPVYIDMLNERIARYLLV